MLNYDCAIFDLDGTLLNTLDDLTCAVNHAMAAVGRPPHDRLAVRRMVGDGIKVLIQRALGDSATDALADAALAEFRTYYTAHIDVHTREYPGITPMLRQLKAAGVRLGVCSNKYHSAAQALIDAHFPGLFDAVVGEGGDIPRKPHPEGTLRAMRAVRADPARTCYIGDSAVDFQTARNAGLPCLSVAWGFADREALAALHPDALCDSTAELARAILGE